MRAMLVMAMMFASISAYAQNVSNGKVYISYGEDGFSRFDQSPVKFIKKFNFTQPKGYVDYNEIFSNEEKSPLEMTEQGDVRLVIDGNVVEVIGQASKGQYGLVLNLNKNIAISSEKINSFSQAYSTCRAHFYSNRGVNGITEFQFQISRSDEVIAESEYRTSRNLFNIPSDIPFFCRD